MELPNEIERAVRRYDPIIAEGLTLYPVRVAEYDSFTAARPALELMQQSLPLRFLSMPVLSAMYLIDMESMANTGRPVGLFSSALLGLALALRLGEGRSELDRIKQFRVIADKEQPKRLLCLKFLRDGEEYQSITPVQYQRLRPILAAQNGVELYGPDANPEIIQAERELAELNSPKLESSIEDLICSVATATGTEEAEIDDWAILKLARRAGSLQRMMDYMICGFAESQGTKWKSGNPAPHPFFRRAKEGSGALVSISEFGKSAVLPFQS